MIRKWYKVEKQLKMHSPDTYNTSISLSTLLNRSSDEKCHCTWSILASQSNMP